MKKVLTMLCAAGLVVASATAQEAKPEAGAAKGDAKKGKETFEMCSGCHAADSDEVKAGPSLKGLFAKPKLKNGQKPTDQSVMKIVNEGGTTMPPYADILTAEDKANLLAYLKTL